MEADREAEAQEAIELRDALLGAVAGTASELSEQAERMRQAADWLPWQKKLMLSLLVVQAVCMVALLAGVLVLVSIASTNRANGEATKVGTARIRSCTTPGGECYERSQAQTATAIALLQRYTLIAVECAHEGSDKAIEACVLAKSREQGLVK